jgi:hypothetical protein
MNLILSRYLTSAERPPQVDCARTVYIHRQSAPVRNKRDWRKVIGGAASEDDDLKRVSLLLEQGAKPVHPMTVTLYQLIVQDNRGVQILRQR